MPRAAYVLIGVAWALWVIPFLLHKRHTESPATVDRRARWGMLPIAVAYTLVWQGSFWLRSPGIWRIACAVVLFFLASLLSWSAVRALGRQWRLDAALNPDHELVRSGPYRIVRHPIYTSMLCTLLGTALALATPVLLLLPSLLAFAVGTEVRVRIEEKLLVAQFGENFRDFQRSVGAYIPFLT